MGVGITHSSFFIHLDKKQNYEEYVSSFKRTEAGVKFIDDREEIFWGGHNMICSTLSLAKYALSHSEAAFFVLLSDDTFPLFGPDKLLEKIFSEGERITAREIKKGHPFLSRYEGFFYLDSKQSSARHQPLEDRQILPENLNAYARLQNLMRRGKKPIQVFHGSQWWILKRETLSFCIDVAETDTWLRESFEFSAIPDEMFFQTIIRNFCSSDISSSGNQKSSVFSDFSRNPKPYIYTSIEEIERKQLEHYLFIRKVRAGRNFLTRLLFDR